MGPHRTALPWPQGARRTGPTRAVALGGLLTAVTAALTLVLARQALHAWPGTGITGPEDALLALVLTASTVLSGWVALVLMLVVADLVRQSRGSLGASRSASPMVRWASATLLAITATPGPAALAGPPEPSWSSVSTDADASVASVRSPTASDPDPAPEQRLLPDGSPVPLPGWTPAPVVPPATPTGDVALVSVTPREAPPDHVVVRAGDTLWSIAAGRLGRSATVQDVAEEWPRWYAANRDVIGPDPDLILPGQQLRIPGPGGAASSTAARGEAAQGEGAGR